MLEHRGERFETENPGNWFLEAHLVIARLDKLSRSEDVQQKLQAPDYRWDLVVCDEAHKMSATFFGGEVKYTKRYRLGQLLSSLTRHFLLMTATPHNGKEEDFQLFMALIDGDRFEGRFRDGRHRPLPTNRRRPRRNSESDDRGRRRHRTARRLARRVSNGQDRRKNVNVPMTTEQTQVRATAGESELLEFRSTTQTRWLLEQRQRKIGLVDRNTHASSSPDAVGYFATEGY